MSALAARTGAINLGQGFPDTDGPAEIREAAVAAMRAGAQPVPARPRHPRAARGRSPPTSAASTASSSTPTARCSSPPAPPRRSPPRCSRCASPATRSSPSSPTTTPTPRASPWPAPPAASSRCARPDYALDPDAARRRLHRPHPARPAQLAPQPDRQGLRPRRARARSPRTAASATSSPSPTRSTSTSSSTAASTSRSPRCPGMAERTLTISSAGKTFSFTGWKIGWATGPRELVAAVADRQAVPHLRQRRAVPARDRARARAAGRATSRRFRAGLQAKRDRLCAGLRAAGLAVFEPAGTYFVTADIRPLGFDDGHAFCLAAAGARGRRRRARPSSSTTTRRRAARSSASRSASATR